MGLMSHFHAFKSAGHEKLNVTSTLQSQIVWEGRRIVRSRGLWGCMPSVDAELIISMVTINGVIRRKPIDCDMVSTLRQ